MRSGVGAARAALLESFLCLIDRLVRLKDRLKLEKLKHLEHVTRHTGELQIATVVAQLLDLADEDTPSGRADVRNGGFGRA